MNRFDRYIIGYFVKYTLIVLFMVMIAAMFATSVSDINRFSESDYSIGDLLLLQLISFPIKLNSTLPITIVVASIVTVVIMMRNKEMLAYVSLGGQISRLLKPFILIAVIVTGFMLVFDYKLYPQLKTLQAKQIAKIRDYQYIVTDRLVNIWIVDSQHRLVHVELIDPINKTLLEVTEYVLNDEFQVNILNKTTSIVFNGEEWVLTNFRSTDLTTLPPVTEITEIKNIQSGLFDDLTSLSGKRRKELMPAELSQMIKVMKNHGLNAVEYEMLLYSIFASAFSVIVLVIVVVPMGIDFSRRYSPIKSSIISFILGLSFWGVSAAMSSFGTSGIISPLVANFSPLIIFLAAGSALLIWRERAR